LVPSRRLYATNEQTEDTSDIKAENVMVAEDAERALTPKEVVKELDKHIIGQQEAKKAVAIALRNRWRRKRLPPDQAAEVIPKNILMIGPTGVGKTEIARRISKLAQAPFIKVEATKFTEVGYYGRDVDTIIRDLMDIAVHEITQRERARSRAKIAKEVEERLLSSLVGEEPANKKEWFRQMLRENRLEDRRVTLDIPQRVPFSHQVKGNNELSGMSDFLSNLMVLTSNAPRNRISRKMSIAEARPILEEVELDKMMNKDVIIKKALESVENNGIVFIDEIDKICTNERDKRGSDASAEGVQRDLLPLIEGTTINTKYGNVDTTKILFIASGAFHSVKPSDLLAELQGRLPIRVQLKPLSRDDFYRILTETQFNQIDQARALLATEGIELRFTDAAVREIAKLTSEINETVQNIGARRLHTVLERILEDVSYECTQGVVTVDVPLVRKHLSEMLLKTDLSRYVL